MIKTQIQSDFFLIWSLSPDRARKLIPQNLRPFLFEDKAWLSFSVVELTEVRFFGLPVARRALVAALLLLVQYRDRNGLERVGNYFLQGFTDDSKLAWVDRYFGFQVFKDQPRPRLSIEEDQINFDMVDLMNFQISRTEALSPSEQTRMEELFRENHSGVFSKKNGVFYSDLEKEHWRMPGVKVRLAGSRLLDSLSPHYEFAFDTSHGKGHWHWFQKAR